MASKKQPTRKARASKRIPAAKPPSLNDLLEGARELSRELSELLRFAEHGRAQLQRNGKPDASLADGFRAGRLLGYFPDEMLAATVAPYLMGEHRRATREMRGMQLVQIAAAAATAAITPERALALASDERGDDGLNPQQTILEIRDIRQRSRSKEACTQKLYDLLGRGADVLPVPDTRSGARGLLKRMIKSALDNPVSWLRDNPGAA